MSCDEKFVEFEVIYDVFFFEYLKFWIVLYKLEVECLESY